METGSLAGNESASASSSMRWTRSCQVGSDSGAGLGAGLAADLAADSAAGRDMDPDAEPGVGAGAGEGGEGAGGGSFVGSMLDLNAPGVLGVPPWRRSVSARGSARPRGCASP